MPSRPRIDEPRRSTLESVPIFFLAMALLLAACGVSRPPANVLASPPPPFQQQDAGASLFPGDAEVLSDSAIRRILAYDVALPPEVRVAILELGTRGAYRTWWSEETARWNTHVTDTLIATLHASDRVAYAEALPLLLVPQKRTVPYLREAAARFQADLLLVYQPTCGVFERSRFLAPNHYRVTCTVEAVVLETRSGVVPFTDIRTRSIVVQRGDEDFNERDMLVRGQFQAVAEAVGAVAEGIVARVEALPATERQ
jgi:hypothetical protein